MTAPKAQLHNCWGCRHNGADRCCDVLDAAIDKWTKRVGLVNRMPPKDADGCPGWEGKDATSGGAG